MKYKLEAPIHGKMGFEKYTATIKWRHGSFVTDESDAVGGKNAGPDPHSLLASSLAACTLATLRMYIDRKGWDIPGIEIKVNLYQYQKDDLLHTVFDRDLRFETSLPEEQKNRLLEIANLCPISKILKGESQIRTFIYSDEDLPKKIKYSNDEISVIWKPELCKHSGRCVSGLPAVFNVKEHPWIRMEGADTEAIIQQVQECPTGAISIQYHSKTT
jgi:putative redox protein